MGWSSWTLTPCLPAAMCSACTARPPRKPAGWSAGRKLRLKGKGLPAATPGDLYLELQLTTPPADSEQAKAAYAAFAQAFAGFQPRQGV